MEVVKGATASFANAPNELAGENPSRKWPVLLSTNPAGESGHWALTPVNGVVSHVVIICEAQVNVGVRRGKTSPSTVTGVAAVNAVHHHQDETHTPSQ